MTASENHCGAVLFLALGCGVLSSTAASTATFSVVAGGAVRSCGDHFLLGWGAPSRPSPPIKLPRSRVIVIIALGPRGLVVDGRATYNSKRASLLEQL
jgi:hypothetical protein